MPQDCISESMNQNTQIQGAQIRDTLVQDTRIPAIAGSSLSLRNTQFALGCLIIGILVTVAYFPVMTGLVDTWWRDPGFTHGFLVPIFSGYLVWNKRKIIIKKGFTPTWIGILVVAAALVLLLLGAYGATVFLSRVSLVVLLAGLVLSFAGWQVLKDVRFALLVLFLAIPLPTILFNQFALPLQLIASELATSMLRLFDVPVLRQGNIIQLPSMELEVAEACSGIRSLVSLFTLAIFYGYFLEKTYLRRAILALASIPIAIAANAVRIFGTGLCVQYWDPDKAVGFFHEFSGWVIFLVSLGCLFIVHSAMRFLLALRGKS